jgi:hypothetical protein
MLFSCGMAQEQGKFIPDAQISAPHEFSILKNTPLIIS